MPSFAKNRKLSLLLAFMLLLSGCSSNGEKKAAGNSHGAPGSDMPAAAAAKKDTATTQVSAIDSSNDKEVPILCYHQIRDWKTTDPKYARTYIMPVANFREQMQVLHDSGYHTILPDQLIDHITRGTRLPSKPIMLTFDDGPQSQIDIALPELDKAGFKAVFFIMTVVLGHNNFMTGDEVKKLSQQGHVIGCHTWNHTMVTKYKTPADYTLQIDKPKATLEKLLGMPVKYFAYPYGIWNAAAVAYLRKAGFIAAFQLAGKIDEQNRLFLIRRQIADPYWSKEQFLRSIKPKHTPNP